MYYNKNLVYIQNKIKNYYYYYYYFKVIKQ
jgi:hypothetical protein